jgi:phosphohistidine phosphatase
VLEPEIYEASVEQLLSVVQQLPETAKSALLVGHNPGFEELLGLLTADGLPAMPTAALACLQLAVDDWQAAARRSATIAWAWSPERGE